MIPFEDVMINNIIETISLIETKTNSINWS